MRCHRWWRRNGIRRIRPRAKKGRTKVRPYKSELRGQRSWSSVSGATRGALRRNFMRPSPLAFPARFLKKSAAVSITPTFSATAAAIHWFRDTPSSFARRWAAFLTEFGSFNGYLGIGFSRQTIVKYSIPSAGEEPGTDGTFSPEEVASKENTVAAQALRKSLTLIPASRRIARRVPSAMSPEWCGSVTFLPVWGWRQTSWLPAPGRSNWKPNVLRRRATPCRKILRGVPFKRQKQERGIRASTEPCSGTQGGADRRVPGRIPRFFWRGLERFRPFRQRCGLRPPIPERPGWYPNSGRSSDSRREPEWPLLRLPRGALAASLGGSFAGHYSRYANWAALYAGATTRAARLAELVFRFRRDARGVAKEFHEAVALGCSRTLLEKVRGGFNYTHLFGDGGSNPLVQGHAVLFREALGSLLDGVRKLQWISRHRLLPPNDS